MASNFFQRWSSRKLQAREDKTKDVEEITVAKGHQDKLVEDTRLEPEAVGATDIAINPDEPLHDGTDDGEHFDRGDNDSVDTPVAEESALTLDDVVKVTFDSGVTPFMKEGVEKSVKKAALRKLFQSDEFNYISDMDDHTEDFSNIPALDAEEVKGLRNWITEMAESVNDVLATTPEPLPTPADGIESGVEIPQSLAHYSEPQEIAEQTTQDQVSTELSSIDQPTSDQVVEEDVSLSQASAAQENVPYRSDSASKK